MSLYLASDRQQAEGASVMKILEKAEVLDLVVEQLRRKGLPATLEYPGFIALPAFGGGSWNWGVANEKWGADYMSENGESGPEYLQTEVPSDSEDIDAIADAIAAAHQEDRAIVSSL